MHAFPNPDTYMEPGGIIMAPNLIVEAISYTMFMFTFTF